MPTVLPVDDDRLTAAGLLVEVARAVGDRLGEQVADHGLTPSEFEAMLRLARSEDRRLRMADLATQTAMSASGLSRLVDRLSARGLVGREACAEDVDTAMKLGTNYPKGPHEWLAEIGSATIVEQLRALDAAFPGGRYRVSPALEG